MKRKEQFSFAIIACLTLGLAPFVPEPHIVGKLRWVFGGAVGMKPMDYLDLLWHGLPWLFLLIILIRSAFRKKEPQS